LPNFVITNTIDGGTAVSCGELGFIAGNRRSVRFFVGSVFAGKKGHSAKQTEQGASKLKGHKMHFEQRFHFFANSRQLATLFRGRLEEF